MAYEPGEPEFNPAGFKEIDRLTELDEELTDHPDLFQAVDAVDAQTNKAEEIAKKNRDAMKPKKQAKQAKAA